MTADDCGAFAPLDRIEESVRRRLIAGAEVVTCRTGKALYYQADRADRCFLVLSGSFRTVVYRSDESALDLGAHGGGEWLGLPEMVGGGPYLSDAVALESSKVLAFGATAFSRLRAIPAAQEWLPSELARTCYALYARVELTQPSQRLVRWLLDHAPSNGDPILCTQEELALEIGSSRETVNRHLNRLQGKGLLRIARGSVSVCDAAGLEEWG